jgi:EmrB/QacA subfamily drug resistance transporter
MSLQDRTQETAVQQTADEAATGGRKLGLALLVIATAQLMLILDNTIMNVALPSIQKALHMATADLNWVITAYALSFGGLLLAGGRAGDLFGRRAVFRTGLIVFTAASLVGGLSPNSGVLIGARLAQGLGAAITAPTALSLLATTFPAGPARNKALGVYGAMGGLGSVVGLLLGGVLTEYASWRWVLFINVPIAIAVLLGTSVLVSGERDRGRVDWPGALAATLGAVSLVYAITQAGQNGWSNGTTLTFLIAGVVLIALFAVIQTTSSAPMLPPRVLAQRDRLGAILVMLLVGAGLLALFYFLTLYMQIVKGYSAMTTGVAYLPFVFGIGIAAGGLGPRLLGKLSARAVICAGLVLAAGSLGWLSTLTPGTGYWSVLMPAQLMGGLGAGLVFVTATVVAMHGVAPRDTGIAAGLVNTAQQIGGALGLATLASVAATVTRAKPHGTPVGAALTDGYTTGLLIGSGIYVLALVIGALAIRARVSEAELH